MTEFKKFTLASSYYSRGKLIEVSDKGIFQIYPTKKKINANTISFDGVYPYVARGEGSNGIRGYINYEEEYLNPANTISFGQDTGTMYYQDRDYFTGDKIQIFKLNPKLNKKMNYRIALYLIATLRKIFATYTWGQTSFALDKISYIEIELPVDSKNNEIDFQYMEDRVKALEQDRVKALANYLTVTGLDDYKLTKDDKNILSTLPRTKSFTIGELMVGQTGDVDIQNKDISDQGEWFINSGVTNRGIKGKTTRKAKIFPGNTITIDFFGNANYRSEPYKLATHNHVFSYSGDVIKNEKVGLYLVSTMRFLTSKYSYSNMATRKSLKDETLELPIDAQGNIDFKYMENYIKAVQKLTIKKVIKYKDEVIDETKEIIN